jgi:hypothetical protein
MYIMNIYFLILLFIGIVIINSIKSLKGNWAFFYDTKLFRKFFPFHGKDNVVIKHPLNKVDEPIDIPISGFKGLFKSPKSSYSKGIETFSLSKGSKLCKPCGYTNVDGNLCISKCQITELKTRGHNDPIPN